MKCLFSLILISFAILQAGECQEKETSGFVVHGIVMDATTLMPVPNTQIMLNRSILGVTSDDGTFGFAANKNDTLQFSHLGYKAKSWIVPDTLTGNEFVAGIYLHSDTVSISEVFIFPRFNNLKSQIINSPSRVPQTMENARYNVARSAYQGRTTQGKLGDPQANYNLIHQRQGIAAYEKGGIPSSAIAGISPLMLVPAAYLLLHGLPEKPSPFENKLTKKEIEQVKDAYFKMQEKK